MDRFIELGIQEIPFTCQGAIRYADLGGGEGFLTKEIVGYFQKKGYPIDPVVADGNEEYLKKASVLNLPVWCGNIRDFPGEKYDLITMRSVNHYNSLCEQKKILDTSRRALNKDGYLISQILSTNDIDCHIVSSILNLPSLGRTSTSNPCYLTTATEYIALLKQAKFRQCVLKGIVAEYLWWPEISWERFNGYKGEAYKNNSTELKALAHRKSQFISEANDIIKQHLLQHKNSWFKKKTDNSYSINLIFPLIVACK